MRNRNTLTRTARTYRKGGKSKKRYGTRLSEDTISILDQCTDYHYGSAVEMIEKGVENLVSGSNTAISFADWLHLNYQPTPEPGEWYSYHPEVSDSVDDHFTTEELFEKFIAENKV